MENSEEDLAFKYLLLWGFEGVEHKNTGNGVRFMGELAVLDDTYLVGKIKGKSTSFCRIL